MMVEDGEDLMAWQETFFPEMQEFLDNLWVCEVFEVIFEFPIVSDLSLVLVIVVLENVFEEAQQIFLLSEERFVS